MILKNLGEKCKLRGKIDRILEEFGPQWMKKIARRTTGAKGSYLFAGFLQETHIFLKHLLKFCSKSLKSLLQVSKKLLTNILRSLFLVPNKTLTYHDSSL